MAQSTTSGTSSRRYMREHDVPSSSRYVDTEWESKEVIYFKFTLNLFCFKSVFISQLYYGCIVAVLYNCATFMEHNYRYLYLII